jgi:AcrR family transcriptional regulator
MRLSEDGAQPRRTAPCRASGRGRPSKAVGLDLKQTILDAAEGLFARHGFYGVTTRQVATEAGVDTALIHYYFGAKRELFDAVFLRRAEILNRPASPRWTPMRRPTPER